MKKTTNYKLKKIELTDSPPDITVHSNNFDIIDAELKRQDKEAKLHKADLASHHKVITGSFIAGSSETKTVNVGRKIVYLKIATQIHGSISTSIAEILNTVGKMSYWHSTSHLWQDNGILQITNDKTAFTLSVGPIEYDCNIEYVAIVK